MNTLGRVINLDAYRKNGRPTTREEIAAFLRNINGPHYYALTYNPNGNAYKPKPPQVHDLWVTASVSLHLLPSTGSTLLDWLNSALGHTSRYELNIAISGTEAGFRIDKGHQYPFNSPAEVKQQIDWERSRVCGNGEFYFQNYTGELNDLFIELDWVAAK